MGFYWDFDSRDGCWIVGIIIVTDDLVWSADGFGGTDDACNIP